MADTKISAETSAGALTGAEIVPVVRGTGSPPTYSNLRTTTQDIANLAGGGGGGLWAASIGTVPTLAGTGFSGNWINQGGASANDRVNGFSISCPSNSGDSLRVLFKTAPATPFKALVLLSMTHFPNQSFMGGLGFIEGTGATSNILAIHKLINNSDQIEVIKWNDATTFGSKPVGAIIYPGNPLWFYAEDDGTNAILGICQTGDPADRIPIYSEAKSGGFLADYTRLCIFGNKTATGTAGIVGVHAWDES